MLTAYKQSSPTRISHDEDKQFRLEVPGKQQIEIEETLINAKNGVFVLFTPTHGTPLMISEEGIIPEGLIPAEKMDSYDATVKPRVKTTHDMPKHSVKYVLIRHQAHRAQAGEPSKQVDETHYNDFLKQYPELMLEKIVPKELYEKYAQVNIPAAFYYWVEDEKVHHAAIFGKQINQGNNKLLDPGVSRETPEDLELVNQMLKEIGLPAVDKLQAMKDLRELEIPSTSEPETERRRAATI